MADFRNTRVWLGLSNDAPGPIARVEEPLSDDERRQAEILELFDEYQDRWAVAIGRDHHRSQCFKTWTKYKRPKEPAPEPRGPSVAQLKRRVRQRRELEAQLARPYVYAAHIQRLRALPHRGGNYAKPERVERAKNLRRQGLSIREIQREIGLSRETLCRYVSWISRSDGMRRMHVRLKAEGRPMVPPWRREAVA